MTDFEETMAQILHQRYIEISQHNHKNWEDLSDDYKKSMISLIENLFNEGIIEPGRFFRYIRMDR